MTTTQSQHAGGVHIQLGHFLIGIVLGMSLLVISSCQSTQANAVTTDDQTRRTSASAGTNASDGIASQPLHTLEPTSQMPYVRDEPAARIDPARRSDIPVTGNVRYHTVEAGDTLYGLARRFYGDGRQWRRIYQANLDVIKNEKRLEPGTQLIIP